MILRLPGSAAASLFSLGLCCAPGLALAQTATTPPGTTMSTPATTQEAPQTAVGKRRAQQVEEHIRELHRRLHITAAQQPQWDAFAQVMRENALHMDQAFQARADEPNADALQDMQSYAAIAEAHAQDMQRLVPAFQSLYDSLTPQQQRAADQTFREFEHRRG